MPELPEVENVRLSLSRQLVGRRVRRVEIRRADVVRGEASPSTLLTDRRIGRLIRHGKQLALAAEDGPCLCVHLGMTGSLQWEAGGRKPAAPPDAPPDCLHPGDRANRHTHLVWHLDDGGRLIFRDARRFGGVWTFPSLPALWRDRWNRLGPDARTIGPAALHRRLQTTRRPLKAALLDQTLLAGLGNIYVDELLFGAGQPPHRNADTLSRREAASLVRRMRTLMTRAIEAGGSSFRDYVNALGRRGDFQRAHRVYGRSGLPCRRCRAQLARSPVAGRTTVFCPVCQAPNPRDRDGSVPESRTMAGETAVFPNVNVPIPPQRASSERMG